MQNIRESNSETEPPMEQMLRRIQSEFLEMPGLRLTLAQAQRLWNVDGVVCEALFAALVDVRFLVRTIDGFFIRNTDTISHGNRRVA